MVKSITQMKWQLIWRCDTYYQFHSLINTLPFEGTLPSGVLNGTSSRVNCFSTWANASSLYLLLLLQQDKSRVDLLFTIYPSSTTTLSLHCYHSVFHISTYPTISTFTAVQQFCLQTAKLQFNPCSARPSFLLECLSLYAAYLEHL